MKTSRLIGLVFLGLLWAGLVWLMIARGGGVTLKNLFVAVASAIIIFVPIYKKYRGENIDNQ
ncbi:MAG: hypothetical protein NC328_03670 [Muribaculum sp.]|nr:hypothetical protein [Muribaculum sp.]